MSALHRNYFLGVLVSGVATMSFKEFFYKEFIIKSSSNLWVRFVYVDVTPLSCYIHMIFPNSYKSHYNDL